MFYLTGKQALEIQFMSTHHGKPGIFPDWTQLDLWNTEDSLLGSYGIETGYTVPQHDGTFAVADTVRALLDLIVSCRFLDAEGFRQQPYWNENLMPELFYHIWIFHGLSMWEEISTFLWKECGGPWRLWNLAFDPVGFRMFTAELIERGSDPLTLLGPAGDEYTALSKSCVFSFVGDIRDLNDLTVICAESQGKLTAEEKESVYDTLRLRATVQLDFLVHTQRNRGVDTNELARRVLQVCDIFGVPINKNLRREIGELTVAPAAQGLFAT